MSSLKKTAVIITIITIGSKIIGFGREVVLAYFFGTSYVVDAYLMSITIPNILFGWINTISMSYTPIYTGINLKDGHKKSLSFTNNIISVVLACSLICIILCYIFNKQIVTIFAPGFSGDTFNLTSRFLNISVFSILFSSVLQVLSAYLNCNNKFIESSLPMLFFSSTQIVFIVMSGIVSTHVLIYGYIVAVIMQFFTTYLFSYKECYRFKFNIRITPEIKKTFILVIPIFISSAIIQINSFVDKSFASVLAEGSISALNYANILRSFIFTIFTVAITTMIYPLLSKSITEKNIDAVKNMFSKSINLTIILFIPITIGAILLATPAIQFVYERGAFSSQSTILTSTAFIMYSIGILPLAFSDIITRVFYSMQDTKSVMITSIISVILNIILNFLLIKPLKHNGLALATSLSSIFTIPILFVILRKKLGSLYLKNSLKLLLKSCFSTSIMAVVVYFSFRYFSNLLGTGKIYILISLVVSASLGGIIYFALMVIIRVKEMDFFIDIIHPLLELLKHKILKK